MKLETRTRAPERILLYGDPGSGKSKCGVDIAKVTTGDMYVIDTDYSASWYRSLEAEGNERLEDRVHVTVVGPDDWPAQLAAVRAAVEKAGEGDWIVLDSATPTWLAVRTLYITKKWGDDFFDFFTAANDNKMGEVEMNWNAVNSEYAKLYRTIFSTPAHVLLTAEADALQGPSSSGKVREDRAMKSMFQQIGFKPKGQKTLAYTPHTVLWLNKTRVGEYHMTTAKDRERREMEGVEVKDFARDYLMRVAGWRPVK